MGKSGCIRAKMFVFAQSMFQAEVVLVGQNWLYSDKEAVFVQKWLYSGNLVVFGQVGCILEKGGCIPAMWLYSGKSSCTLVKWLCSGRVVDFGKKLLYSGKMIVFG